MIDQAEGTTSDWNALTVSGGEQRHADGQARIDPVFLRLRETPGARLTRLLTCAFEIAVDIRDALACFGIRAVDGLGLLEAAR